MKSAAQKMSRYGYADMVLEHVASNAGYTRGALYHLFANKEGLALAVVDWVEKSWLDAVGFLLADETDPVGTLIALARGTAVYSRRDVGRVLTRLRTEFAGTGHPVGKAANETVGHIVDDVARLITAGRTAGAIPPGPPARVVALAYLGSVEGVVNQLGDQAPFDALFAVKVTLGVLGLPPMSETGNA